MDVNPTEVSPHPDGKEIASEQGIRGKRWIKERIVRSKTSIWKNKLS
jgi:hypothetical protein